MRLLLSDATHPSGMKGLHMADTDIEWATKVWNLVRRAAEIVGADRVLFVSHSEDAFELADAQIRIGEARVKDVIDLPYCKEYLTTGCIMARTAGASGPLCASCDEESTSAAMYRGDPPSLRNESDARLRDEEGR
ncbi:MAG: hypothetical protein ACOY0T_37375 [Myxococcota bacterium]